VTTDRWLDRRAEVPRRLRTLVVEGRGESLLVVESLVEASEDSIRTVAM